MFKFYFFIIFLICDQIVTLEIECPLECKCDMYKNFRRASCINRSLIVVDVDIPTQVEVLDLSYNLINALPDHIFYELNLFSLRLLNLSHNKISDIHMNAFNGIDKVKTIDLSHNTIEYLLENWFWNLPNLEELYLQGNSLRRLHPVPILDSQSIRILNLRGCSLHDIHHDTFKKLSNLEVLDLSKNDLIQLKVETIKPLPKLKRLTLDGNPWHCNNVILDLIKYCKKNNIKSKDPCIKTVPKKEEKFQRIMVETTSDSSERQNSWIVNENVSEGNETKICVKPNETVTSKSVLMEVIELSPVLALMVPFILGLTSGLVIACTISRNFFEHKVTIKKPSILTKRKRRQRRLAEMYDRPLIQSEAFENPDSTPMPLRKNIFNQT